MVQRLLLDRVHAESARPAVGGQDNLAVLTGAHEAQPALSILELAEAGTDIALDASVIEAVPVFRRHD
jgi:hypothetical protein